VGHSHRIAAVLTVVAVLISVAPVNACSRSPKESFDYMRVELRGQAVLGVSKRGVDPRGVVVYFHGLDKDQDILTADDAHIHLTNVLTSAGFAVVAGNAGGNAFGNRTSQDQYADIAKLASERYKVQNVFFLAESMGTLAAVNMLARAQTSRVRGLAAISPALNLESTPPAYQSAVAEAYPEQSFAEANPMNLPVDSFQGKHFRFYVTLKDAVVSTKNNAKAFQARFGAVADISIIECTGAHLDPSCIQPENIVDWFKTLEYRT
jgi:pimeloyl-ACP methyl ester carboxylesterase